MDFTGQFFLVVIAALVGILVAVTAVLFSAYRRAERGKYDVDLSRAQLEDMRAYFESQIRLLTERLLATEERWRDVNHLLISAMQRAPDVTEKPERAALTQFLQSFGIGENDLKIETDLVFVLTPFHPDFRDTFAVISETCRNLGLRCLRGDEEHVSGDLLPHILRLLVKARIVIANIDGRNPNVFYELGIAQAIDKPTILISSSVPEMPLDVRTRKIVVWGTSGELRENLQTELARTLARPM